ncbi:ribosome recycling factor [Nocardioides sp. B-3]|uniref:ribosome recycling factor n=1 Tax=Nocardioides sp. B-3 TaxID=2895565 RepID=UPI002152B5A6|nr:ribosome recycling factor [Nocardioides sp. B-3]UUZ59806.1 ribosome recycling factor [Nocardioides sp. B-3]
MINEVLNDADNKMGKSVEATREEFAAIRAGRVNPEHVRQDHRRLLRLAHPVVRARVVHLAGPRTILIAPFDIGAMPNIEKAIHDSDLGVNPSNDGKVLRAVFPELTEERRKDYIKIAKGKAEDGRVAVRNVRRTAKQGLEKLEKDGEVGKDDVTGAEKKLDSITKKHTDAIDDMLKNKEAELLEV